MKQQWTRHVTRATSPSECMAHTHMKSTLFSEPLESRLSFTPMIHTIPLAFTSHATTRNHN